MKGGEDDCKWKVVGTAQTSKIAGTKKESHFVPCTTDRRCAAKSSSPEMQALTQTTFMNDFA